MTSRDDYRGLEKGKRQGCRYFTSDGKVFDADWNAAINIAQRYSKTNDKLPTLFSEPLNGKLNLIGRPSSTGQSWETCNFSQTPAKSSPLFGSTFSQKGGISLDALARGS
jgi:hypothetical protein